MDEFRISTFADTVAFRYVNWRGDNHRYEVRPESLAFGPYTETGGPYPGTGKPGLGSIPKKWVLHAQVVTRDGEKRPGRRTFLISKIQTPTRVEVHRTGGT